MQYAFAEIALLHFLVVNLVFYISSVEKKTFQKSASVQKYSFLIYMSAN